MENTSKPPVFSKWRGWYWLLILVMLTQLLVYAWITNHLNQSN